ncbi:MAG: asparagine synthetase B, partial [Desulfamplus sp.]|nr:asparagine synthetase B [Desulfamplus sp.]
MCGIFGLYQRDGALIQTEVIKRATQALAHRGPDGIGYYIDSESKLGLGHCRLSIFDTSPAASQPMHYQDRLVITYNGEIYNFLELRDELKDLGHSFQNDSDTEVVLAAYAQWGTECQNRFNGMWALSIWDKKKQELFLSRDRFGIKPLYLLEYANTLAFASEMKGFLHLLDFTPQIDETYALMALEEPLSV